MRLALNVPDDLQFSDLRLSRTLGKVSFDWAPVERICQASGIDVAIFTDQPEANVCDLLAQWYGWNLADGGPRDPVADELFQEAVSELN